MAVDPDERGLKRGAIESSKRGGIVGIYDILEWNLRALLDKFCVLLNFSSGFLIATVSMSVLFILGTFLFSFILSPILAVFLLLSVVPAFFAVWYIWETDPYEKVPATLILATFLLSCLLIVIPLFVNTAVLGSFKVVPGGISLFFFFIVAPIEEGVKWLAVRLYGYNKDIFNSAVDGAVLGAVAGLAFAMMENAIYISGAGVLDFRGTQEMTLERAAIAPLHVMWSAVAGYYLGLAKVNKKQARTLVFKGLLVAGVLHGTYNTAITYKSEIAEVFTVSALGVANTERLMLAVFLVGFYSLVAYYPVSKLNRYRKYSIHQEEKREQARSHMPVSEAETDSPLQSHGTGVVSLSEDGESYSVPVSYGYYPDDGFVCLMLACDSNSEKREWDKNTETESLTDHEMEDSLEPKGEIVRENLHELTEKELNDGYKNSSKDALFAVLSIRRTHRGDTEFKNYRIGIESVTGLKFENDIDPS